MLSDFVPASVVNAEILAIKNAGGGAPGAPVVYKLPRGVAGQIKIPFGLNNFVLDATGCDIIGDGTGAVLLINDGLDLITQDAGSLTATYFPPATGAIDITKSTAKEGALTLTLASSKTATNLRCFVGCSGTETHAGNGKIDWNYGEIVQATITGTAVTLSAPLSRDYSDPLSTSTTQLKLYFYTATQVPCENITILGGNWNGGGTTNSVIFAPHVIGLTVQGANIFNFGLSNAAGSGLRCLWCQDVTVANCSCTSNSSTVEGNYGVLLTSCKHAVVSKCWFPRFHVGCVIKGGSHITVRDITGTNPGANDSQVLTDIHGGDPYNVRFEDIDTRGTDGRGKSDLYVGNVSWRRGAQKVTVSNCYFRELKINIAVRDLAVVDTTTESCQIVCTSTNDPGVVMNSTGANKFNPRNITFLNCNLFNRSDSQFPVIAIIGAGAYRLVENLTLVNCTLTNSTLGTVCAISGFDPDGLTQVVLAASGTLVNRVTLLSCTVSKLANDQKASSVFWNVPFSNNQSLFTAYDTRLTGTAMPVDQEFVSGTTTPPYSFCSISACLIGTSLVTNTSYIKASTRCLTTPTTMVITT